MNFTYKLASFQSVDWILQSRLVQPPCARERMCMMQRSESPERGCLLQACKALIIAGADPNMTDSSGTKPQDVDEHAALWDVWQAS